MQADNPGGPLVEMTGVSKIYNRGSRFFSGLRGRPQDRVIALNQISLSIEPGEIFGLVGQSGSGKTTAGRLLVKLEEPTQGTLSFRGKPISGMKGADLRQYRSRVQMIFQDPYQSLNPHLSISETILEPLQVNRIGTAASRREKVFSVLETVGLLPAAGFYDRYPHQLSGGQRQRVAIARAIVLDPDFIVADEPTSMLDATIAIQLFRLLLEIRQKFTMSFLFITHNLAAAGYLCDRIAVIHEGKIVEVDTANAITRHPKHPYTQKLIQVQPGFTFQDQDG